MCVHQQRARGVWRISRESEVISTVGSDQWQGECRRIKERACKGEGARGEIA